MLTITTDDKKITVDKTVNGVEAFALNSLAFAIYEDGVTLYTASNRARVVASPISKTSVNGTILTADTAVDVLSALMTKIGGSGGGGTGDQEQANYTERDTTAVSYIKNKPYKELPEGTALPTTANAGDIIVYMNAQGKPVAVWSFDGFVWSQTGADYNLIFEATTDTQRQTNLNGYSYKKVTEPMHYVKMLPSVSDSYISATRVDKTTTDYTLYQLDIQSQSGDTEIEQSNFKARSFSVRAKNYEQANAPKSVYVHDAQVDSVSIEAHTDTITLENLEPVSGLEDDPNPQINFYGYAKEFSITNITRPNDFQCYSKSIGAPTEFVVSISDFHGVKTSIDPETGTYTHGSNVSFNNSDRSFKVDAHISFRGNVELLSVHGFGSDYAGATLFWDIQLNDYGFIHTLELSTVSLTNPEELDTFLDEVIADGTVRNNPMIGTAYFTFSRVEHWTLTDERKTALEALGITIDYTPYE